MQEIVEELEEKSSVCLVDAVKGLEAKNPEYNILPIIKGDDTSYSIACASIVAKVYRDNLMEKYEEKFPGYGFSKHTTSSILFKNSGLNVALTPCINLSFFITLTSPESNSIIV